MTEYEKLSLQLLALIAQGISFQVTESQMTNSAARYLHNEQISKWQQLLSRVCDNLPDSTAVKNG